MPRLKIKQVGGLCVFCGRPGLTKEHVWPQWTHSFLAQSEIPRNVRTSYLIESKTSAPVIEETNQKQGEVQTLQVRVVCKNHCNGGWMSRLETEIQPILIPLMRGEIIHLGKSQQRLLAQWIAKTVMMLEFADHKRLSSSQFQREFLMDGGEPPPGWSIWIANFNGSTWKTKALRASAALTSTNGSIRVVDRKLRPSMNTQSVTFGMGRLLIQVVATTVPFLIIDVPSVFLPYAPQIWPFQKPISWPNAHVLNDADAIILSNGLGRMIVNDPDHSVTLPM